MAVIASAALDERSRLDDAIGRAFDWLDREQAPEGFWVGVLESSYSIEAEWLLAMHILGFEHERKGDIVATLLAAQRADGSWEAYYEAPQGDINSTVECYAALRSTGMRPDAEPLVRAREWIFAHGGLSRVRVFTRYWLALLGEWPWNQTPNLPPEVIANPRWFPFNIYNFASWARATLVPLAVLSARRATKPLPPENRLDELFPDGRASMDYRLPHDQPLFSLKRFFLGTDRLLHWYQQIGLTPGRRPAVLACLEWIIRHQDADGAWGGIQPPWIYSLLALHFEGYALTHPVMARGLEALDAHWSYERGATLHLQASESPVWDTELVLLALQDCGREMTVQTRRAVDWLLDQEIRYPGDWSQKVRGVEPSGWAFERANLHYPDIDDTAVALIVLARLPEVQRHEPRVAAVIDRAVRWVLAMQSSNGGWAAFDRDNDKLLITMIPFCDFGEALDPPSADVTAHIVEMLAAEGRGDERPCRDGLRWLLAAQEPDGSWFGRWGANHVYGTGAVVPALVAAGVSRDAQPVRAAVGWLERHQNGDGGWGEDLRSYVDPSWIGRGASTPSQTAWALLALLAAGEDSRAVRRGVEHLVGTQRDDGGWDEDYYTGTGFPGDFYISYHLYRLVFPIWALGRYVEATS